jgi:hypothetical protein
VTCRAAELSCWVALATNRSTFADSETGAAGAFTGPCGAREAWGTLAGGGADASGCTRGEAKFGPPWVTELIWVSTRRTNSASMDNWSAGVRTEHRVVADGVDQPRQPLGILKDQIDGGGIENALGILRAAHAQAMADVAFRLLAGQSPQVEAAKHALAQLPHVVCLKAFAQFGLAHDNDLEQLGVVGFEIADHPHLLERIAREGLGLVEHQHHRLAFGEAPDQKILQAAQQVGGGVVCVVIHLKLTADAAKQIGGADAGVVDSREDDAVVEVPQHQPGHQRFARAHLTGQQDKALALADGVDQRRQRFFVIRGGIEEARIGRVVEGQFTQAEKRCVHGGSFGSAANPHLGSSVTRRRTRTAGDIGPEIGALEVANRGPAAGSQEVVGPVPANVREPAARTLCPPLWPASFSPVARLPITPMTDR